MNVVMGKERLSVQQQINVSVLLQYMIDGHLESAVAYWDSHFGSDEVRFDLIWELFADNVMNSVDVVVRVNMELHGFGLFMDGIDMNRMMDEIS